MSKSNQSPGGVQEHSKGEIFPWVISFTGYTSRGHYWAHHPDGRESPAFHVGKSGFSRNSHTLEDAYRACRDWVNQFGGSSRVDWYGEGAE